MDERDLSLILEGYLWAPRHVRLEIAWSFSNELIRVINVICIISLHGSRENCMIKLYKGDIVMDPRFECASSLNGETRL